MQAVLEAVREGAAMVPDVELVVRPALSAGAADLLAADGVLLGTPANIGYMSGALKHFFDTVYYPCLDATVGLPYGVYVHGNDDTAGALTSIGRITGALRWKQVAAPLQLIGAPGQATWRHAANSRRRLPWVCSARPRSWARDDHPAGGRRTGDHRQPGAVAPARGLRRRRRP